MRNMALETGLAFLLADCYDTEDFAFLKTTSTRKRQKNRRKQNIEQTKHLQRDDSERYGFKIVLQNLTISDFKSQFKLTLAQTEELVRLLAPCTWTAIRQEGWTVWHAVIASLWTLSTQESYHNVASRFHVTESLIRDQLDEFCNLVTTTLGNEMCWPQGEEAEMSVMGFFSAVGLPGTLCVVGTSYLLIEKPTDVPDPEAYNAGQAYSVTLMSFCNHRGRFIYVTAEHPRNWHNSRVLVATEVGKALQKDPVVLLNGKHIIGDSTYPLSEHFLTPFPDYSTLGQKRECYNRKVQSALKVVQGAIYTLKSSFKRLGFLQKHSICQTNITVKACCILYNMFLETCSMPTDCMKDDIAQKPFHELPYGHSGSLGGISKRQDLAASLGRTTKKRKYMYK